MERLPICFVLMPLSLDFKNQWDAALKPAIIDAGLRPYRGDDEPLGTNIIMSDVTKFIFESQIIVAELTGRNPNVMYELGLAHAAKKPVIMLIQKDTEFPFDVSHVRYLPYDPRDLFKLRTDLVDRIKSTLAAPHADLFPELQLLRKQDIEELEYLRRRSVTMEVMVRPSTADIFLNDKFIGTSPQTLYVNPASPNNTLSVAAVEHFEYYIELSRKRINPGAVVDISLDSREKTHIEKRVPKWLRFRRNHPDSPVLMHAISQYLCNINEIDEAFAEAEDLLRITPYWYMAHNQMAYVYQMKGDIDKTVIFSNNTIAARPDHALGYIGLACIFSLSGEFSRCIEQLAIIETKQQLIETYALFGKYSVENDPDFTQIKADPKYGPEFNSLVNSINEKKGT